MSVESPAMFKSTVYSVIHGPSYRTLYSEVFERLNMLANLRSTQATTLSPTSFIFIQLSVFTSGGQDDQVGTGALVGQWLRSELRITALERQRQADL